jgi:hypothetical protein
MRAHVLTLLLSLVIGVRADAQDSTKIGWMTGISLGVPGYRHEAIPQAFTFGGNFTRVHPGHLGPDFSIGTMPIAIGFGIVPVGARAGLALPLAVAPHLLVIPSAGASAIAALSPGPAGGLAGLNAGIATVVHAGGGGVRAGITWHGFANMQGAVWLIEFGFVTLPDALH